LCKKKTDVVLVVVFDISWSKEVNKINSFGLCIQLVEIIMQVGWHSLLSVGISLWPASLGHEKLIHCMHWMWDWASSSATCHMSWCRLLFALSGGSWWLFNYLHSVRSIWDEQHSRTSITVNIAHLCTSAPLHSACMQ
jgi:hypothetical protein